MMSLENDLTELDRIALNECLRRQRADPNPKVKQQIEDKLAECGWREAAEFACFDQQMRTLKLRPWQSPPCWNNEDDPKSIALLNRMLAAGVSQYDPDPLADLQKKR